jgi:predicted MFS family arabinose efflux permease
VAAWLISLYEWRLSYIILGIIGLVVVVLASQLLKRDPAQVGQMPYGESKGEGQGLKFEAKAFSLKEALSTRQFWLIFSMALCLGFSIHTILVHIAPHTTDLGFSATTAANILATVGGMSVLGRVVLGGAGDRIGNRQVFIIGFALMAAALFWLLPATEAWALYLFAAVFGFAYGGCVTSQPPLVAELFGLRSHGLILGAITFGLSIGAAIGPLLAGYIFDVANSYHVALLVCAVISVVALILTILLTPTKQDEPV